MLKTKAKALAPSITINDNGSALITINFEDEDGVAITGLTALPAGVATPVFASSDQTPGPSAFSIAVDPSNMFATVTPVTPPVQPLASNVDFTVTIASGLVGQTSPISEDAGTISIQADASKPSGFGLVASVAS
jgi:hypothetical protein